jgi:hypothetical protein
MKVEFDSDDDAGPATYLVTLLGSGPVGRRSRLARRWRSDEMRPPAAHEAPHPQDQRGLARALQTKQRSQIRKPDWV